MQNTTNLKLKKPEYTDFADIEDINDNMDTIDEKLHDTKDSVVAFTSSDVADGGASSWTNVTKVASGEKHSSLFAKMSQMFKNIRFLYKLLGTKDISSIGDGTVTGGLFSLNDSFTNLRYTRLHISTIDKPTDARAFAVFFTGSTGTFPLLYSDGTGNVVIIYQNWESISSTLTPVNYSKLVDKGNITGINAGLQASGLIRLKFTYASVDNVPSGGIMSVDGLIRFQPSISYYNS